MNKYLFLCGMSLLAACGNSGDETALEVEADVPTESIEFAPQEVELLPSTPTPLADSVQSLELYIFDCGVIEIGDLNGFANDGSFSGVSDTFVDPCFLVRHPAGDLLWDLGLPSILADTGPNDDGTFNVSLETPLIEQMSELGLRAGDIEYVAISHSHFDHVGQPEAANGAIWLVHQDEYDHMFSEEPAADYSAFEGFEAQLFTGDYDVFGDGSVQILEMPGHTPGHTALLLKLEEAGPVLLSGDMYHRLISRAERKVPRFNTSVEDTLSSMDKFEGVAAEHGARVIIQHSMEDYQTLPKPPEALR